MDSETAKLKERDEKYNEQVIEWKKCLGPRKKVHVTFLTYFYFYLNEV